VANVADFCNQCGNCVTFCPTAGAPWRDKPRFWHDPEGFARAEGDAFRMERTAGAFVLEARLSGTTHRLESRTGRLEYRTERFLARFDPATRALLDVEPTAPLANGEPVDLAPAATLLFLMGSGLPSTLCEPERSSASGAGRPR
ncbi:MAG: hypothetical protein Q8M03_02080, partial [Legionella sp.]|nr:hypothetical protein [Legionella sp.]